VVEKRRWNCEGSDRQHDRQKSDLNTFWAWVEFKCRGVWML
jgi:hypothetical protein